MVELGPWLVEERLGTGSMGEVWGVVHREQRIRAALKVLTGPLAGNTRFQQLFRNEVRAVAALVHPNIVTILDYGVVPDRLEGPLAPGSPYFVMERVDGGSLASVTRPTAWPEVRALVGALLDALAHAHARGVIHRDIKLQNVLLDDEGAPRLVDFGLATIAESEVPPLEGAGTPATMAPEQIVGEAWRQGPWTDLYAVGCVVWALLCGSSPYRGAVNRVLLGHLQEPLPPFQPRIEVPEGIGGWVTRLLAKAPEERFGCAAAALRALEGLDGLARRRAGWRDEPPRRAPRLTGVGLGLFDLRGVALVGRRSERERLWEAVVAAGAREPRVMVLEGASGTGKSRLAQWLCEQVEEEGVATALCIRHGPTGGPADGVEPMLARLTRSAGVRRDSLESHLEEWAGLRGLEVEARPLAALLRPRADPGPDRLHLGSPRERREVAERFLRALGRVQPVVVWVDDCQWGPDAVDLVVHLASATPPLPLAVVCTLRSDALGDEEAGRAVAALLALPCVERIALGPLDPEAHRSLVEDLLLLEPQTAARVCERTAGNPMFATHLVGDWVQRGVLESGPTGFRPRAGATLQFPDSLHQVWLSRLDRLLRGELSDQWGALELAAVLGQEVDHGEWVLACAAAGRAWVPELGERLLEARLALPSDGPGAGFAFVHGMLRECLLRVADERGHLVAHHRACAAALTGADPARRAHHLLAAGSLEEALEPLLAAATLARTTGAPKRAQALLAQRGDAMDQLALPNPDRRRVENDALWVVILVDLGDLVGAFTVGEPACASARTHGWREPLSDLLHALGRAVARSEPARSEALYHEAFAAALDAGSSARAARVALSLSNLHSTRSELSLARAWLDRARAQVHDDPHVHCACSLARLHLLTTTHDVAEAARELARCRDLVAALGSRHHLAALHTLGGNLALLEGRTPDAEQHHTEALRLYREIGSSADIVARVNLSIARVMGGRYDEALPDLEALAPEVEAQRAALLTVATCLALLPCLARAGRWAAFDARADQAAQILDRGVGEPELGLLGDRCAAELEARGELARAERARARRAVGR